MKATYTLRLPEELRDKIKEEAKQSKILFLVDLLSLLMLIFINKYSSLS